MKKKLIFVLVCMLVFSTVVGATSSSKTSTKSLCEVTTGRDYTHTVFVEVGTGQFCGPCHGWNQNIYNTYNSGTYDFEYVEMIAWGFGGWSDILNLEAYAWKNIYGINSIPTSILDGDYQRIVGNYPSQLPSALNACGNRAVSDVDVTLDITWLGPGNPSPDNSATNVGIDIDLSWTNAAMDIEIAIQNNEATQYNGYIRVPIAEITSRYLTSGGDHYHFGFLDYAFEESISIDSGGVYTNSITWDGKEHADNHGDDFGDITQDNIKVIAGVFNLGSDYVDDTTGLRAGTNTDPKTYDVYFGTSSPPPLVVSNQSATTYDPGILTFDTTYYWKIVAWDNLGASFSSPIWSFTTRGNDPPNIPSNPSPTDGETDVNINVDLGWIGGDPDGDTVTYDVYFGTSSPPSQVEWNQSGTVYDPGILEFEKTYYWKIHAWDEYGASSEGSIWSFTTEENVAPYIPSDPDPEDGETDVNIEADLSWTGGDPNPGDTVTYDVYFGDSSLPPKVASNQTGTTYDPATMDLNTTYYWQIVSWDSQEESTSGPIWHFTTAEEPNVPPNKPSITGPQSGNAGTAYDYDLTTIDSNGDDVKYFIDWGDGTTEWTDYYGSGEEVTVGHTWDEKGAYTIRVKAKDTHGEESEWETLDVQMPMNQQIRIHPILQKILELFPNAFPVLRHMLGL